MSKDKNKEINMSPNAGDGKDIIFPLAFVLIAVVAMAIISKLIGA